jgi:hypothetical protein
VVEIVWIYNYLCNQCLSLKVMTNMAADSDGRVIAQEDEYTGVPKSVKILTKSVCWGEYSPKVSIGELDWHIPRLLHEICGGSWLISNKLVYSSSWAITRPSLSAAILVITFSDRHCYFMIFCIKLLSRGRDCMDLQLPVQSVPITNGND